VTSRGRLLAGALAFASLSAFTACGGSSSGTPDAGSATPSPPAASSTPSPSASATGPAYAPATGTRLSMAEFSANVPKGWRVDRTFGHHIRFADNDRLGEIEYSDVAFYPGTSLAKAARLSISNSSWDPRPRIEKHVLIDGDAFYHLSGPVGDGIHLEEYAAVRGSSLVKVSFSLTAEPAARARIVGSVLETLKLN
jgi:hypothetical protein